MDETSTSSIASTEKMLRTALKNERYGTPSDKTIEFIRSFASSFRFIDGLPEGAASYSLN
jgi:hypothetical protein